MPAAPDVQDKKNAYLLMEETGCNLQEAELALSLSDNDIEKAITTIGVLLKYISAFKIKIILADKNIYGLMHIAVNMKTAGILRFNMVVSHNPSIYEIHPDTDWFSFEKAIFAARLDGGAMEGYTQSIEQNFKNTMQQALQQFSAVTNKDVCDVIETVLSPAGITAEITMEELSLTQFKKLPDYSSKHNEASFTNYDLGFVRLEVELLEDVNGKPVEKISEGDTVLSLITDNRDIAHYLAHLIGGRKDGQMIPLAATVKKIASKNDDFEIYLHYAPSVTGAVTIKKYHKIKVLETKSHPWWKRIMPW